MNTSVKTTKRCLHLVDIENLMDGPFYNTSQRINKVLASFLEASKWRLGDLLVIAANPELMKIFAFDFTQFPVRLLCGWGNDGADKLLLSAIPKNLDASFSRIVVGSGDHIFASLFENLHLDKTVVYGRDMSLSWELYVNADHVIQLDTENFYQLPSEFKPG